MLVKNQRQLILFIAFFLSFFNHLFSEPIELKFSKKTVNSFYDYISSDRGPLDKFLVTLDGEDSYIWICPQTLCMPVRKSSYIKLCSKHNDGKLCKIFAVKRKIKSVKKNKIIVDSVKFTQGDSFINVKQKLKILGYVD